VASPLLANLYMRRFVLGWKACGHQQRLDAHIVNYADDFVICCKPGKAALAMTAMRRMMDRLKLTVNEKKTRECHLREDTFTFLGFTFGRQISWRTGRAYVALAPADKKIRGVLDKIYEETGRSTTWRNEAEQVRRLNAILRGWGNYFRLGNVTKAWQVVQQHTCRRLRQWLRRKHGQRRGARELPDLVLYQQYGLVRLRECVQRIALWA
jgi:hypothetical protein